MVCHQQTRHEQESFHVGTGSTNRTEQNFVPVSCSSFVLFLAPLSWCVSKCVTVQAECFVGAKEMQLRRNMVTIHYHKITSQGCGWVSLLIVTTRNFVLLLPCGFIQAYKNTFLCSKIWNKIVKRQIKIVLISHSHWFKVQ